MTDVNSSDEASLAPKDATDATRAANAASIAGLNFNDRADFDRVNKGRLAGPQVDQILNAIEFPVWDFNEYDFVQGECPETANPSLWRQEQLNDVAGLFEVEKGFYQVRGFDLSNITFIEGKEGWLVIDPLTAAENAKTALELVTAKLGERPITAVIYTHSHVDHFGGVRGIISEEDVASGNTRIIAPEGFLEHAISENIIAGNAMKRRALFMYGPLLPANEKGHIGCGLGRGIPKLGTTGLIAPTESISETGTELEVDGVRIVFQNTPGTEAPAEMNFFFPDSSVLCMAENCTATFHNLYTLRGAQVRNPLAWSKYITESIELFGAEADTLFASHHWPRWGKEDIRDFLTKQRDLYRYVHDQTMRMANHGHTMLEIAEHLELPESLNSEFFNRGYYGTLNHNVKAVYQRYLGWFDANPAHLHPHEPAEASRRYVDFMGGADAILEKAKISYDEGDYRWVAEVVNHIVFADPGNTEARILEADALEQMGYQAESGPWRNFYLNGAQELRTGIPEIPGDVDFATPDVVKVMTVDMLLELVAVRLNGPDVAGDTFLFDLKVPDRDSLHAVGIENGALHSIEGRGHDDPEAVITVDHDTLAALAMGGLTISEAVDAGTLAIEGDRDGLERLFGHLDKWNLFFSVGEP